MKTCTLCGETKPLDEFRANKTRTKGRSPWCKPCARVKDREYREKRHDKLLEAKKRWRQANRERVRERQRAFRAARAEQVRAHEAVHWAIRAGKLVRPHACEKCGEVAPEPLNGHHEDYSKPLEVTWLCRSCHAGRHRDEALVEKAEAERDEAIKERDELAAKVEEWGWALTELKDTQAERDRLALELANLKGNG